MNISTHRNLVMGKLLFCVLMHGVFMVAQLLLGRQKNEFAKPPILGRIIKCFSRIGSVGKEEVIILLYPLVYRS